MHLKKDLEVKKLNDKSLFYEMQLRKPDDIEMQSQNELFITHTQYRKSGSIYYDNGIIFFGEETRKFFIICYKVCYIYTYIHRGT